MGVLKRLEEYLDGNTVNYRKLHHSPAFTAQETAASAHVPGKELAKTVVVKTDEGYALVVLPACFKINLKNLRSAMARKRVEIAEEKEFEKMFPDCEVGAMPPFGNLYSLPVYVAKALSDDEEIVFNAGTHTDMIRMSYRDFEKLVKPVVADFSEPMN